MARRKIIEIDEEKCDGCGLCIIGCAEGALELIDGKAKLVSEVYCDGLGACLGECPTGALQIIEREAEDFDEEAVSVHLEKNQPASSPEAPPENLPCGCPGSLVKELAPMPQPMAGAAPSSALRNWPVQLHLVPTTAPFFKEAELLISADCCGFSLTGLHQQYLPGKSLIIACPKLDDIRPYEDKLAEIFRTNQIKGITVLYMTVPCCTGLVHLVKQALNKSGKSIPLHLVQVSPEGDIALETKENAA
ncbi:MAG: 4Fe-4S ferredoxin [bacterium]|nr:4Fe-4S ferredoxin [bacterium]